MKSLRITNETQSALLTFRIRNAKSTEAEIDIFDRIGDPWDGTAAKDFVPALRDITADRIRLNINSPGGYVNDALAIYDAILNHPSEVHAYITVAASAASFVAMAADKRYISKNGKVQIHDAQAGIFMASLANVQAVDEMIEALQNAREVLEEESQNIASIYAERAGGTVEDWRAAMQANGEHGTTYRGEAAVEAGLCDEVTSPRARDASPLQAVNEAPPAPDEAVDDELFKQVSARGYEPPMPSDISRLIERNMAGSRGGSSNG